MPIPTECNIQILYSSLEVVPSLWAARSGYRALLPKLIPSCVLLTSIPTEQGGHPQHGSLHLVCALTKLGQRLPIYRRIVVLFSNDCANMGCIPLAKMLSLRLKWAQIIHAQTVVGCFYKVWRCLVKRASLHALGTRVTIHEGSMIPVGLSVSGHGSGIPERACHGDLALLILGSLASLGVIAAYFSINFDFAPHRERHLHRNHAVRAVRLIEVNG
jgi:hypothetical protein